MRKKFLRTSSLALGVGLSLIALNSAKAHNLQVVVPKFVSDKGEKLKITQVGFALMLEATLGNKTQQSEGMVTWEINPTARWAWKNDTWDLVREVGSLGLLPLVLWTVEGQEKLGMTRIPLHPWSHQIPAKTLVKDVLAKIKIQFSCAGAGGLSGTLEDLKDSKCWEVEYPS